LAHINFYNTSWCDYSSFDGNFSHIFQFRIILILYRLSVYCYRRGCEFIIQIGRRVLSSWFHMQHVIEFRCYQSIMMPIFRASAQHRNCVSGILTEYRYLVIYLENKRILSACCRAAVRFRRAVEITHVEEQIKGGKFYYFWNNIIRHDQRESLKRKQWRYIRPACT